MGVLIKDIQRNSTEIIRIEVSEFKGRELINIRIWYQSVAGGEVVYKPTQKGVTLNINEFHELKDGIDRLSTYIADRESDVMPEQPEEENKADKDSVAIPEEEKKPEDNSEEKNSE